MRQNVIQKPAALRTLDLMCQPLKVFPLIVFSLRIDREDGAATGVDKEAPRFMEAGRDGEEHPHDLAVPAPGRVLPTPYRNSLHTMVATRRPIRPGSTTPA